MSSKVWVEIAYPFQIFNCLTVEVWGWINNFTHTLLDLWLLIHAGFKLIHVSERARRSHGISYAE